jgi:hypothetical protein
MSPDTSSSDRFSAAVESVRVSIDKLERGVSYLRHLRVGGVLVLMLISAILGAGGVMGVFYRDYQRCAREAKFMDQVYNSGISLDSRAAEDGFHLMVNGPVKQATRFKDDNGNANGVELVFPNQDRR